MIRGLLGIATFSKRVGEVLVDEHAIKASARVANSFGEVVFLLILILALLHCDCASLGRLSRFDMCFLVCSFFGGVSCCATALTGSVLPSSFVIFMTALE